MKQITENKISTIINLWINGNKKDASQKVKRLSKVDLAYLLTHNFLVYPDLIGNKEKRGCLENFVINSLEGMYS
jgi:hypothetical protein